MGRGEGGAIKRGGHPCAAGWGAWTGLLEFLYGESMYVVGALGVAGDLGASRSELPVASSDVAG